MRANSWFANLTFNASSASFVNFSARSWAEANPFWAASKFLLCKSINAMLLKAAARTNKVLKFLGAFVTSTRYFAFASSIFFS